MKFLHLKTLDFPHHILCAQFFVMVQRLKYACKLLFVFYRHTLKHKEFLSLTPYFPILKIKNQMSVPILPPFKLLFSKIRHSPYCEA